MKNKWEKNQFEYKKRAQKKAQTFYKTLVDKENYMNNFMKQSYKNIERK